MFGQADLATSCLLPVLTSAEHGWQQLTSNPMKLKNTKAAPLNMPSKPKGAKGCMFLGSACKAAGDDRHGM
jgi:hypothetical protein